jgi:hypothetical protein
MVPEGCINYSLTFNFQKGKNACPTEGTFSIAMKGVRGPTLLAAECRYAECHYAECRYAECRYAECG